MKSQVYYYIVSLIVYGIIRPVGASTYEVEPPTSKDYSGMAPKSQNYSGKATLFDKKVKGLETGKRSNQSEECSPEDPDCICDEDSESPIMNSPAGIDECQPGDEDCVCDEEQPAVVPTNVPTSVAPGIFDECQPGDENCVCDEEQPAGVPTGIQTGVSTSIQTGVPTGVSTSIPTGPAAESSDECQPGDENCVCDEDQVGFSPPKFNKLEGKCEGSNCKELGSGPIPVSPKSMPVGQNNPVAFNPSHVSNPGLPQARPDSKNTPNKKKTDFPNNVALGKPNVCDPVTKTVTETVTKTVTKTATATQSNTGTLVAPPASPAFPTYVPQSVSESKYSSKSKFVNQKVPTSYTSEDPKITLPLENKNKFTNEPKISNGKFEEDIECEEEQESGKKGSF